MSKFRETIVTNCEKGFLIKSLNDSTRLDGRAFNEFRELQIELGKDWGSCYVSLGKTKVLAQTSCEVQEPKSSRPSEGILNVNIDLSPLSAPHFEAGRQSDLSVQLNRLLEKCLKDSKTIDLESLCIKINEKVWAIRVDINVLNHDGNILDCSSIAALTALAHFRRQDITWNGEDFIIHSYVERDPIPLVVHHYPIYVSYSIFNNGTIIVADPTVLEENAAEAQLQVGVNSYRELCGLHFDGKAVTHAQVLLDTIKKASERAAKVVNQIKETLEQDKIARQEARPVGFQHTLTYLDKDAELAQANLVTSLDQWQTKQGKQKKNLQPISKTQSFGGIQSLGKGSAILLPKDSAQNSSWKADSSEESEDEVQIVQPKPVSVVNISSGSEEDVVQVLDAPKKTKSKKKIKK